MSPELAGFVIGVLLALAGLLVRRIYRRYMLMHLFRETIAFAREEQWQDLIHSNRDKHG